jgi:radical SAM superfamily enzyme YgiQ (UPF0313 family)
MKIDLIRVPEPESIADMLDEPLGLMYLAASLKKAGYDVRITNLAGCDYENWKDKIQENADIYGLGLYTPTSDLGIKIAKYIKDKTKKIVICGGPHPSAVPHSPLLHSAFDHIIVGEADETLVELVRDYEKGKIPDKLIFSKPIENLDSLPIPARELVDIMNFERTVDGKRCFGLIGSKGCPFQCAFCDRSVSGSKLRYRSVPNIMEELKQIKEQYGVVNVEFFDDVFTVNKERLREFKEAVKGFGLSYRCNGRTDVQDEEVYKMLKESGCSSIAFGIESGSQMMLDKMNKRTTVEMNLKAIKIAQNAGLTVIGYFILGFPGETLETIEETKKFIEDSDVDQAQIYTFVPEPGCDVYRNPEKYGVKIISRDFKDYNQIRGTQGLGGRTIETDTLSSEQLEEQMIIFRKFLKERGMRGKTQKFYEKLDYKKGRISEEEVSPEIIVHKCNKCGKHMEKDNLKEDFILIKAYEVGESKREESILPKDYNLCIRCFESIFKNGN